MSGTIKIELLLDGDAFKKVLLEASKKTGQTTINVRPGISGDNSELTKLSKFVDELNNKIMLIGQSEINIKIGQNTQKLLDQFSRLTGEDKKIIIAATIKDPAAGKAKLQEALKSRGYTQAQTNSASRAYDTTQEATAGDLDAIVKKYADSRTKLFAAFDKIQKDFETANSALNVSYEAKSRQLDNKIADLRRELDKVQSSNPTNVFERDIADDREVAIRANIEGLNRQKTELTAKNAKDKDKLAKSKDLKDMQAFGETVNTYGNGILGSAGEISKAFNGGTNIDKVRAIGNTIKQIPVIGTVVGGFVNFGAGIAEMFTGAKESWEAWNKRQMEAMKAKLDYELYTQNEILRVVKQQQQVVGYIDKLYSGKTTLQTQNSLEQLQISQDSLQNYTLNGVRIGDMTDEQLLENFINTQNEQSHLQDLQAQASYLQAQLIALFPNASIKGKHDFGSNQQALAESWGAYVQLQNIFTEIGAPLYSFWELLDKKGTPVEDLNTNMSSLNALINGQVGMLGADLEALEGLADVNNQILDIQQAETAELESQIDLNNELSGGLKERLRALKNAGIDDILEKMSDIEYQMSVGMVDESTGDVLRKNYMTTLSGLLSGLGEDILNKEVLVTRSGLLQTIDASLYDSLAGKGDIVEFHTGGQVTQSGLASLQAGEYVLRADQLGSLTSLSDNIGLLANANTANNTVINTPVNIYVDSVKSDGDIANIQKAVYTALDDIQNRTGAKALRFN